MRVLIIGAGAVGTFVGARLALAGHDVTLVGRSGLAAAVRGDGLTLIEPPGTRHTITLHAVDSIAAAFPASTSTSISPYDLALVTVKAYDTASVTAELRAIDVGQIPPLLTLQNGVGNEEALAEVFGANRIISGAIDTPVSVPAPGQVQVHRERFKAGVAPVGQSASAAAGRRSAPRCRVHRGRLRRLPQPQVVEAADEPAGQRPMCHPGLDAGAGDGRPDRLPAGGAGLAGGVMQ